MYKEINKSVLKKELEAHSDSNFVKHSVSESKI